MNSHNANSSSIVHKGYFHGHDTLPLHGKTCSSIDEKTENGSRKTPPTTHSNVRWRKGSEVKSENLNTTHAKSCLHRDIWNGQQYDRSLRMLMHSVITSHNNVIKLPLMWSRSIVEGPSILTPNLVGRALLQNLLLRSLVILTSLPIGICKFSFDMILQVCVMACQSVISGTFKNVPQAKAREPGLLPMVVATVVCMACITLASSLCL